MDVSVSVLFFELGGDWIENIIFLFLKQYAVIIDNLIEKTNKKENNKIYTIQKWLLLIPRYNSFGAFWLSKIMK